MGVHSILQSVVHLPAFGLWLFVMNGSRLFLTSVNSCSRIIFNVVQLRALLRHQVWEGLSWVVGVHLHQCIHQHLLRALPQRLSSTHCHACGGWLLLRACTLASSFSAREIFSPWNACLNDEIEAWKGYVITLKLKPIILHIAQATVAFLLRTILLPKLNM